MLNLNLIERLFDAKAFDRLLNSVAANGLELPLPLQVRLSQAPAGGVAMALRRATELAYGRTDLARRLSDFLLADQGEDGSFDGDPLITAAAAAALGRLPTQRDTDIGPTIVYAREAAIVALAGMQAEDGLFFSDIDRSSEDRALTAAFVLFLLGGDDLFRRAIRIADLCRWFEQRHDQLDRSTRRLWRMSGVGVRKTRRRAGEAIAA